MMIMRQREKNVLKVLTVEFQRYGAKFETRITGHSHIQLSWRVGPDKDRHSYIIPTSSGDRRCWLNARAGIRRLFRADGLLPPI
jgi:hypothetical protein